MITNLLSAIPVIGGAVVEWVWGGFAVNDATLHRFFVFHFALPFILVVLVMVHLVLLHRTGSRNPLGVRRDAVRVAFHPYYVWKDLVGVGVVLGGMLYISLLRPDLFLEPENYIPANALVTPAHIKPEWYFLWVYAILRAIPNKLGGVVALFVAILILFSLPFLDHGRERVGCGWSVVKRVMFWSLVATFFVLTWLGRCPAEEPYNLAAKLAGAGYFSFYLVLGVWCNFEKIGSR